jgi:hypothetical protein
MGSAEAAALLPLATAGSEPLGITRAPGHSSLGGDEVLGQGNGEQMEPKPLNTPAQAAAEVSEQVGDGPVVQQALPQMPSVQVVPTPWKTLGPVQLAMAVTVQAPVVEQHAPEVSFAIFNTKEPEIPWVPGEATRILTVTWGPSVIAMRDEAPGAQASSVPPQALNNVTTVLISEPAVSKRYGPAVESVVKLYQ